MKKAFIIISLFFLAGCQSTEKITSTDISPLAGETKRERERRGQFFTLTPQTITPTMKITGNIEAKKSIPISAKIMGRMDQIYIEVGDHVKKGQIIARYSALDNDSYVQYQSAISQFQSMKATAKNMVNTAEVAVQAQERQVSQVKKEEEVRRKKQFKGLYTNAKLSEIQISQAINFIDQKVKASAKYRGTSFDQNNIGYNNQILKNKIISDTEQIIADFAKLSHVEPKTEKRIFLYADIRLHFLKKMKNKLLELDRLIQGTSISNSFAETTKNLYTKENQEYLSKISTTITHLENHISETKVLDEQLGLKVLSANNQLESRQSQLQLAKSNAQNQVVAARSQVNIAGNYQKEMTVKAPFSGVITIKEIEIGQLVSPGKKMFEIADISGFKIKSDIADKFVGKISREMPVEIQVDGLENKFSGKISKINPALDTFTRKLGIEIAFTENLEKNIKIGLFARMTIKLPEKEVYIIPKKFLRYSANGPQIITKAGTPIDVEIILQEQNKVQIKSPKLTTDLIIIQP